MYKKLILSLLCFLFLFIGCEKESYLDTFLGGEHKLKEVHQWTKKGYTVKGNFFLIAGSISGENVEEIIVHFWWQLKDGSYACSWLPLEKCRIKVNNELEQPVVTFGYRDIISLSQETQYLMDYIVIYMLIKCKEEHWPLDLTF